MDIELFSNKLVKLMCIIIYVLCDFVKGYVD